MLVCSVGDALLDVIVRLDGAIAADTDVYGRTWAGAGGQAANVAAWASALGGRGRFVGKRADDPAGRVVADELRARGVELLGPVVAAGTGTVVSLTAADGTRTMLSDRGVAVDLEADEVEAEWALDADWLHVPAYSLARPPLADAAAALAGRAHRVSVDLSSVAVIEEVGVDRFRERVQSLGPQVVFATEAELALVAGLDADVLVIKRGSRGCVVRRGGAEEEHPAQPTAVVDGTGAGDAFAAGFLLGGVDLATASAARCLAHMGASPPAQPRVRDADGRERRRATRSSPA